MAIADMPDENRSAGFGLLEDGEAVLDDLGIRVVEARIDEPGRRAPGGSRRPAT